MDHDDQVATILKELEEAFNIEPTVWIQKSNFISNMKNPFKIGLLLGPESPEVHPILLKSA